MRRNLPTLLFLSVIILYFFVPIGRVGAIISTISTTHNPSMNVAGPSGFVYTIGSDCDCIGIFDFSDKNNPVALTPLATDAHPVAMAYQTYQGGYLYVGTEDSTVLVYSTATPEEPTFLYQFSPTGASTKEFSMMTIPGGYSPLLVSYRSDSYSYNGGFLFINIENPAQAPSSVGIVEFDTPHSGGGDIRQVGNYIYASDDWNRDTRVYNATVPSNPTFVTLFDQPSPENFVTGENRFLSKDSALYLIDDATITVYDVSVPGAMDFVETITTTGNVKGAAIRDSILYFSASNDKLAFYNITNALAPTLISTVDTPLANTNGWLSIPSDDGYSDGYFYVNSTGNNTLSLYEPPRVVSSSVEVRVVRDSSNTYDIRLSSLPTDSVTLTLATSTSAIEPCVTISPTSLTFTTSDWDTPQTVTINSISGQTGCPIYSTATIETTSSSNDPYYDSLAVGEFVSLAIGDISVVIVYEFSSVTDGSWIDGTTWGKSYPSTIGVDYPDTNHRASINNNVTLAGDTTIDYLDITSGTLFLDSHDLTVTTSLINNGTIDGDPVFSGTESYNAGTIEGNPTFISSAFSTTTGIINGDAIFSGTGFNLGTVNGTSTFIGDSVDAQGTTTGSIIRKYTSNATTTRDFTLENDHADWILIADGSTVDITDATYSTTTNIFKAINGGTFVYGSNPGGKVVPAVTITTPTSSSTVTKWLPVIDWDDAETCEYSYDNFSTTYSVDCSSDGSDISKPTSAGDKTLYVRGTNTGGSFQERSVGFTYDNTVSIPTSCGLDLLDEASRPFYYLEEDITADCTATADVELRGASTTDVTGFTLTGSVSANSTSTDGYNLTLRNITVTGSVSSNGGTGTDGFDGGNITIATSTTGAISSNGGNGNTSGGNGGTITITDSAGIASSTPITAEGGDALVCGLGGNGGNVELTRSDYANPSLGAGNSQTEIGSGLCTAPPSSPSSRTGSYSRVGEYTAPAPVVGTQPVPTILAVEVEAEASEPVVEEDSTPSSRTSGSMDNETRQEEIIAVNSIQEDTPPEEETGSDRSIGVAILNTLGVSEETIDKVVTQASEVVNSPTTRVVGVTGATIGFTTAVASYVAAAFSSPLAASELLLIPMRLWGLLLMTFGLKKKVTPWGTVYDSVTKRPIDPAYVTVTDMSGRVVAEAFTDIDGRYGFLLPDGTYSISAAKTNYSFPSKKLEGRVEDEMYNQLYYGGEVTVKAGEVINKNIPLDPVRFDWNEYKKNEVGATVFYKKHDRFWRVAGSLLFKFGLLVSIVSIIFNPSTYNAIIFVVYAIIFVLSHFGIKGKQFGYVTEKVTGQPLSYAIFRVLSLDHQTVLRSGVCDKDGRYYCIVPKGEYYLDIEKKNSDGTYSKIYESDILSGDSGFINKSFAV